MGDGQDEHPSRGCLLPDIPPRNDQIPALRSPIVGPENICSCDLRHAAEAPLPGYGRRPLA